MIPIVTVARGGDSRISDPRRVILRTPEEWTALWAAHAGPVSVAPAVDFASSIAAAVFAGDRPSAGYSVEITRAIDEGGVIRLVVEERAPGPGMVAAQIITSPFHIVSMPRVAGEVAWTSNLEPRASHPAPRASHLAPPASQSSSTGLKPTTAAALSYLAGPVSGATILFAESRNEFVRFHAWQAILGIGLGGLVVVLCYVLGLASLFVSASAVPVMFRVATGLWIALIVAWAYCIWQALKGGRGKLPLVGNLAERRAAIKRT